MITYSGPKTPPPYSSIDLTTIAEFYHHNNPPSSDPRILHCHRKPPPPFPPPPKACCLKGRTEDSCQCPQCLSQMGSSWKSLHKPSLGTRIARALGLRKEQPVCLACEKAGFAACTCCHLDIWVCCEMPYECKCVPTAIPSSRIGCSSLTAYSGCGVICNTCCNERPQCSCGNNRRPHRAHKRHKRSRRSQDHNVTVTVSGVDLKVKHCDGGEGWEVYMA